VPHREDILAGESAVLVGKEYREGPPYDSQPAALDDDRTIEDAGRGKHLQDMPEQRTRLSVVSQHILFQPINGPRPIRNVLQDPRREILNSGR
jgi:hypothetical protein